MSKPCNMIEAFCNIATCNIYSLRTYSSTSAIRINAVGDALESYIKDSFANSFNIVAPKKIDEHRRVFSYLGNINHPPDMIIKNGAAIEVKKIESFSKYIALNSSPPKDRLYSDDPRITNFCKQCENNKWISKDLYYTIGCVDSKSMDLNYIFIIDGECYAAKPAIYEKVENEIKSIMNIGSNGSDVEFSSTNELGRVNRVDPLGITYLRIRGMWHIMNPIYVYDNLCEGWKESVFSVFLLMHRDKYNEHPVASINRLNALKKRGAVIKHVNISSPNNPAKGLPAVFVKYSIK